MSQKEKKPYILGTEKAELHRLGIQHQVWASEARKGWEIAEFSAGQTILDLGCGPGFCTTELAYTVGDNGLVIGVDRSEGYINFVEASARQHGLNIETLCADFDDMDLATDSLDGAYCRWALAWVGNPAEVVEKVKDALIPGGVFVAQEYYDWSTFQTEPGLPNLTKAIAAGLKSFDRPDITINIGRELPEIFYNQGLEVISIRPMTKMATAESLDWQWPTSFFQIYFPKLVEMGVLDQKTFEFAMEELDELEDTPGATILCPHMVEVIGVKA